MVNMRGQEADFAARDDPHGYVLKGAPWGSGVRPFRALYDLGLKESDDVLDYGCGALRVGAYLMQYLEPGHYYGIDPSEWAVRQAIKDDGLSSLVQLKRPTFAHGEYDVFDCRQIPGQLYDWVLISGVLTHMDHAMLRSTLQTAAEVLHPGGRILGSYLPSGPDADGIGWTYPEQSAHYARCIAWALTGTGLEWRNVDVPGDPAQWFDAWFEARRP